MGREENLGAQSTFLQTRTRMKQDLIPSNFRTCVRLEVDLSARAQVLRNKCYLGGLPIV